MEDERIIDLYWQRSQEAISRTDEKYGRLYTKISLNILSNAQDAEECVSDTYMALWNSIPPQRPTCFQAFAAAIVRNLSLMKLREQYARKRGGGEFDLVLDELKDTIASGDSVEAECERKEFAAAVNQFLCTLSADDRNIFVCRYWFFASIPQGIGSSLLHTRGGSPCTHNECRRILPRPLMIPPPCGCGGWGCSHRMVRRMNALSSRWPMSAPVSITSAFESRYSRNTGPARSTVAEKTVRPAPASANTPTKAPRSSTIPQERSAAPSAVSTGQRSGVRPDRYLSEINWRN